MSALRKRNHHGRATHHPYIWSTPHPEFSVVQAAALDQIESAVSGIHRAADTRCQVCGRKIDRGHTAFVITTTEGYIFLTCWECGEAIMQHVGFAVAAEYPTCPPYGGGLNKPPG